MTVSEKIDLIVKERYNNYNGEIMDYIKGLHEYMRENISDDDFLEYLETCEAVNPRPVFNLPDEFMD